MSMVDSDDVITPYSVQAYSVITWSGNYDNLVTSTTLGSQVSST
jgi:hypothetical protein